MVSKYTLALAAVLLIVYIYQTEAQESSNTDVAKEDKTVDKPKPGGGKAVPPGGKRRGNARVKWRRRRMRNRNGRKGDPGNGRRRRVKPNNKNKAAVKKPVSKPNVAKTTKTPETRKAPATTQAPETTRAPVTTKAPLTTKVPGTTRAPVTQEQLITKKVIQLTTAQKTTAVKTTQAQESEAELKPTWEILTRRPAKKTTVITKATATEAPPKANVLDPPKLRMQEFLASGVKKTQIVKKERARKPKHPKKPVKAAQDDFFGTFFVDEDVTTTEATNNEPPPAFDPNKPPPKKVKPIVNLENSTSYDGLACNETYKAHDTDPTKYMMLSEVWQELRCPPTRFGGSLVWRQDLCSCGEKLIAQDPNDWCAQIGFVPHTDQHKYMRQTHGSNAIMDCTASLVWSQEKCACIYDPANAERPIEAKAQVKCKQILELKFENDLQNSAQGYHVQLVELKRRGKLPRIRYRKVPGSTDKAAMIVSQPLEFLSFRGNDFQKQVTYAASFKISPRHKTKTNFMVLYTDECIGNQGGKNKGRKPSIMLAFQPSTQTFNLQFRTGFVEIDTNITGAKPDEFGWFRTVVYFEDQTVNMESNGVLLFSQKDVQGKIPQNKCPLYIAGRGQGYDRSQDFYGYLDNVNLVKDCKFHEANIKIL